MSLARQPSSMGYPTAYTPEPGKRYGRHWRDTRPPGLPGHIRGAASQSDGKRILREWLSSLGILRTWLGVALWSLARNESHWGIGKPAGSYNTRPASQRGGDHYTSAWGIYQYNRDAWRGLAERKSYLGDQAVAPASVASQMPHDATVAEELWYPIRRYWLLWNHLYSTGRTDPLGLALSVRVLHSGSGRMGDWLRYWQPGTNARSAYVRWMRANTEHGKWARDHVDIFQQFNDAISDIWG